MADLARALFLVVGDQLQINLSSGFTIEYEMLGHLESLDFEYVYFAGRMHGTFNAVKLGKVSEISMRMNKQAGRVSYKFVFSHTLPSKCIMECLNEINAQSSESYFYYEFGDLFEKESDKVAINSSDRTYPPLTLKAATELLADSYGVSERNISITITNEPCS